MKIARLFLLLAGAFLLMNVLTLTAAGTDAGSAPEKTKPCFQCNATGKSKCTAPTCVNGQVDCPAPCIKLRKGYWVKRPDLHRPDPNETMLDIMVGGHAISVSSHHEGVYYVWSGDHAEMKTCPVCKGTTRVQCKVCQGKGTIKCPICNGKKVVPESWTAFDNPKLKNRPSRFILKDGSVVIGYLKMAIGDTVTIRTEKGDKKLEADDIVSEEKQLTEK